RQANALGGRYPYLDTITPPSAVRAPWPGTAIDLQAHSPAPEEPATAFGTLLAERRSVREYDEARPITIAEVARFLAQTARIKSKWSGPLDFGDGPFGPVLDYTSRPYPSAGGAYPLELYITVNHCEGLARGFYHYDADRHALVPIAARSQDIEAQLSAASFG